MNPIVIINSVNAALALLQNLLPLLDGMVDRGEISVEQQARVRAKYDSLKNQTDGQFQGPHWQVEPDEPTP
jgi:hypothetical protein